MYRRISNYLSAPRGDTKLSSTLVESAWLSLGNPFAEATINDLEFGAIGVTIALPSGIARRAVLGTATAPSQSG
jgi:hypothetical protein